MVWMIANLDTYSKSPFLIDDNCLVGNKHILSYSFCILIKMHNLINVYLMIIRLKLMSFIIFL